VSMLPFALNRTRPPMSVGGLPPNRTAPPARILPSGCTRTVCAPWTLEFANVEVARPPAPKPWSSVPFAVNRTTANAPFVPLAAVVSPAHTSLPSDWTTRPGRTLGIPRSGRAAKPPLPKVVSWCRSAGTAPVQNRVHRTRRRPRCHRWIAVRPRPGRPVSGSRWRPPPGRSARCRRCRRWNRGCLRYSRRLAIGLLHDIRGPRGLAMAPNVSRGRAVAPIDVCAALISDRYHPRRYPLAWRRTKWLPVR